MSNDEFVFTDHMATVSNQLWAVTAMVGAALCGTVLIIIGIVAMNPVARPHLDRVSFRILVCALLANTIFGITNAVGGKFRGPTWACGFTIFLLQLTLEMSSFLLFSIALNLQLVVVHHANGQKMEKFYIFGSILISLCVTIPPYAAKQYGWDPLVKDCWYSSDNQSERLAWQIGTQLFWTLLSVAGEIITASTVIAYMVRHQLRSRKQIQPSTGSRTGARTRSRSGSVVAVNDRVAQANQYKGIIFRIVLYPFASAVINLTSVMCVIHATQQGGVHNWTGYYVLLLSDFVYGGRAVVYALLAMTDPALVRAIRAFIQHSRGMYPSSMYSGGQSSLHGTESKNVSVHVELSTIHQNDSGVVMAGVPKPESHDHSGSCDTKLRQPDIEEEPVDRLGEVRSTWLDAPNDRRIRLQEDMERRRQESLAVDRDRKDFQKQI